MKQVFLLTAGGTGGHLFPAQSLAEELQNRGHVVELATDERAERYGVRFPARKIHLVKSATLTSRSPVAIAKTAYALFAGYMQARKVIQALNPAVVIGFGGYPTAPPLFAAHRMKTPIILHEQNGVLGRANTMLAKYAEAVATSFEDTKGLDKVQHNCVHTGNPVREAVLDAAGRAYEAPEPDSPLKLLVFGGSQGARVFGDLVPAAVELMPEEMRKRLQISQQCRPEDIVRVREAYDRMGVKADLGSFFVDMAERIAGAHIVIGRSGASTVAELSIIGRPSILIPFPHSLDQDQQANAELLAQSGAAVVVEQKSISAQKISKMLQDLFGDTLKLRAMSQAAKTVARPDAVKRLADLAEQIACKESAQPDAISANTLSENSETDKQETQS
jgi:UDP-N-acetylglucosamine--N-acetylmuramyl-(pentapeptide) pyrophosphoryl-undecaprenol N-acetylglucosamine transferase